MQSLILGGSPLAPILCRSAGVRIIRIDAHQGMANDRRERCERASRRTC
jgi:hypothetical protein